jgi:hypothetical protein
MDIPKNLIFSGETKEFFFGFVSELAKSVLDQEFNLYTSRIYLVEHNADGQGDTWEASAHHKKEAFIFYIKLWRTKEKNQRHYHFELKKHLCSCQMNITTKTWDEMKEKAPVLLEGFMNQKNKVKAEKS